MTLLFASQKAKQTCLNNAQADEQIIVTVVHSVNGEQQKLCSAK